MQRIRLKRKESPIILKQPAKKKSQSKVVIDSIVKRMRVHLQNKVKPSLMRNAIQDRDGLITQQHHSVLVKDQPTESKQKKLMIMMDDLAEDESDSELSHASDLDEADNAAVDSLVYDGIPDNSAGQMQSAIRSWTRACEKLEIKPWRKLGMLTPSRIKKEGRKCGRICMTMYALMEPRPKTKAGPKPSSVRKIYGHIKRLHEMDAQRM